MGKKVKEYKSGDFIFAKVKGYPAWPARVQKLNGKKYFVYFYGTAETANLPPNMIFDYAENKDKFLTKTVKRRDFNDGVKQIEYDFANNVPLEQVIGVPMEVADGANDTVNDSAIDATMDESAADTTANDTLSNDTLTDDKNTTQNDGAVEDSDDAGALVIDEGKVPPKGKKSKADSVKTPAKEAPKAKEAKTPRGKAKKEEAREEEKIDEELVSRSGRKIRPKRYIDEQTEENATLPSPAPKRRRGASPVVEKEKADSAKGKDTGKGEKTFTQFNAVKQSELEGLKEPFKPDVEKDNILIAYLPSGTYVGIKLFQSRPTVFKSEASRLQWDKQAAANAITLKMQLERNQITPQSVQGQLVMDLNLTDEEKATLDKERETEEKKSRVNFLKTEMKLIELDAKIKTCLCLEKADTELCLKLLDDLLALEVKPLMLLKHPTCLETVKRMRAYVGNTPSWDLSESAALVFSKQAHRIRKKADMLYKNMKEHFQTPDGLSFWEFFSERVLIFKKVTSNLNAGELLEMVHEPIELSQPNAHTMRAAIDQANSTVPPPPDSPEIEEEDKQVKKKGPAGKAKKSTANNTPSKSKRSNRNKKDEEDNQDPPLEPQKLADDTSDATEKEEEGDKNGKEGDEKSQEEDAEKDTEDSSKDIPKEQENTAQDANEDTEMAEKPTEDVQNVTDTPEKEMEEVAKENETSEKIKEADKSKESKADKNKEADKPSKEERTSKRERKSKEDKSEQSSKEESSDKSGKESDKNGKESDKNARTSEKSPSKSAKEDKHSKDGEKSGKDKKGGSKDDKSSKDSSKNGKESEKSGKEKDDKSDDKTEGKDDKTDDKDKPEMGEPRAKRSRDSKKTEPQPPRSPAKRKSKF